MYVKIHITQFVPKHNFEIHSRTTKQLKVLVLRKI